MLHCKVEGWLIHSEGVHTSAKNKGREKRKKSLVRIKWGQFF